jgi:two-component system sensor histidine kinase KdpD
MSLSTYPALASTPASCTTSAELANIQSEMGKIIHLLSRAEPGSGTFSTLTAGREWGLPAVAIAAVTAASMALVSIAGYVAVALLYLLLVVIIGVNFSRSTVLLTAASSALLWNFLFIPPRFTFYITRLEDLMLFAMFFIVALAMGQITSRLRAIQLVQQQRERRTDALYELVQQAGLAHELDTGLRAALRLIDQMFSVPSALLLRCRDHSLARDAHGASNFFVDDNAYAVAQSAFARALSAGKFTDTLADAEVIGLPLKGRTAVMGVLLISPQRQRNFDAAEQELIKTFALLIGTILEREHLLAAVKHAEILEASEQLRRALLHSVSHELKTPLAAVQTGIEALAVRTAQDTRAGATIFEVQSALRRLHRVINNLLSMSRIESGVVQTQLDWCDIGELIEAARDLAGDNLNYYDDKNLIQSIRPFIMDCMDKQIAFGIKTDVCFCIGEGENLKYLQKLNDKLNWFQKIESLPHPRFIMQYRLKKKEEYIEKYMSKLKANELLST